jgi:phosphoribosylformylglycinamidine (FGAM) synthase PurS component
MHRIEVFLKEEMTDARGLSLARDIHDLGIGSVSGVRVVDIYWLDAGLSADTLELICRRLLAEPVTVTASR